MPSSYRSRSFGYLVPKEYLERATGDEFLSDSETRVWVRDLAILQDLLTGEQFADQCGRRQSR